MTSHPIVDDSSWDNFHRNERFKPVYPLDHIVRQIFSHFPRERISREHLRILDLGCGAGRHVIFLAREGFEVYGTDISIEAIHAARKWLHEENLKAVLYQAEMAEQPFPDNYFDGIICAGVLYYHDISGIERTISEIHRILKKQGKMVLLTRTTDDYRYGKGKKIEENTYLLDINDTNEKGMIMHFFPEGEIREYFKKFDIITMEKTETTFSHRQKKNSDWIVVVEKKDEKRS